MTTKSKTTKTRKAEAPGAAARSTATPVIDWTKADAAMMTDVMRLRKYHGRECEALMLIHAEKLSQPEA